MAAQQGAYNLQKAVLRAHLLKTDPVSSTVPKHETDGFYKLIEAMVAECSPKNIQNCKGWIFTYIGRSTAKITALGGFLLALSKNCLTMQLPNAKGPAPLRRLHILYLVNDLLHHAKYHIRVSSPFSSLRDGLKKPIEELIKLTAPAEGNHPRLQTKMKELLDLWKRFGYYEARYIDILRTIVEGDTTASVGSDAPTGPKEVPFIMPGRHGYLRSRWDEQPAGLMVRVLKRNPKSRISHKLLTPIDLRPGPASPELVEAVKGLLQTADRLYTKEFDYSNCDIVDIDVMGHRLVRDESSGKLVPFETYYGWSADLCKRRIASKKDSKNHIDSYDGAQSMSEDSRGRSISRDGQSPKRRRYDSSMSSQGSRGRGHSRGGYRGHDSRSRSIYTRSPSARRSSSRSRSPYREGRNTDSRRPSEPNQTRPIEGYQSTPQYSRPPLPQPPRFPQNSGQAQLPPPPPPPPPPPQAPAGYTGYWNPQMPMPQGGPPQYYQGQAPPPPPPALGLPPPPPPPNQQHPGYNGQYQNYNGAPGTWNQPQTSYGQPPAGSWHQPPAQPGSWSNQGWNQQRGRGRGRGRGW